MPTNRPLQPATSGPTINGRTVKQQTITSGSGARQQASERRSPACPIRGADPEDPDEYSAQGIFWVPPEARWQHLKARARQPITCAALRALAPHQTTTHKISSRFGRELLVERRRQDGLTPLSATECLPCRRRSGSCRAASEPDNGRQIRHWLSATLHRLP